MHDAGPTSGAPMPAATPTPGPTIRVNRDNVLKIAAVIYETARDLEKKMLKRKNQMMQAGIPAHGDPVSADAARVFLGKLVTNPDSYYHRAMMHVTEWRAMAERLKKTAQDYGYSDEGIADAFKGIGKA